jgi:hypothetical protein
MTATVSVKINQPQIKAKIAAGSSRAQQWLDAQVIKDTEPFVPMIKGTLYQSAHQSTIGSGEIKYRTRYARAQYYGLPNKTKSRHPQATMRWFEHAKATHRQSWLSMCKKMFGMGWGGVS